MELLCYEQGLLLVQDKGVCTIRWIVWSALESDADIYNYLKYVIKIGILNLNSKDILLSSHR